MTLEVEGLGMTLALPGPRSGAFGRCRLRSSVDRETADEIKRHFNVVAEGLRSEIRTVSEGLQGFREEVAAEFRAVREEIGEVKP
jgi:hypothetical protein